MSASHGIQHSLRRVFPPLIPIWVITFDFSLAFAGLLLGIQSLGSAIGQAPFGVLADRYDRRYILPTGIAFAAVSVILFVVIMTTEVFVLAFTLSGYTIDLQLWLMLLTMIGVGLGGSVLHPAGYPLISENVSDNTKGTVYGFWGSAAKIGDGVAPAIVGALLLLIAWTNILLLISTIVILYALILFVVLGRYETRPKSLQNDTADDDSEETTNETDSTLDVWEIDRRYYIYPMLAVFCFFSIRMLAAGGVNVFIPEFITSEYGYSFSIASFQVTPESTASFYYSALLITAGLVQLGTGRLVDRFDARKVIIGFLFIATGVLLLLATGVLSPIILFFALLVLGGSLWAVAPARDAIVSEITPAEREGRTFGYLWTGALIVSSLSPILIGFVGDNFGLRLAFGILAASTLLSTIPIALLLSNRIYVNITHLPTPRPSNEPQTD